MKFKTLIRLAVLSGLAYALLITKYKSEDSGLRNSLNEELSGEKPVGLQNPLRNLSAEDLRYLSGTDIDLDSISAHKPRAYCIMSKIPVFGIKLEDSDRCGYDIRFADAAFEGDLSGMYYKWDHEKDYPQDAPECRMCLTDEGQGICTWSDDTRKYSISMSSGATAAKLAWMKQKLSGLLG